MAMSNDSDQNFATAADLQTADRPREFGDYVKERQAVQAAMVAVIGAITQTRMNEIVPEENVRRFMHGRGWSSPAVPERAPEEMVTIQDEWAIAWQDIADHDLTIIPKTILGVAGSMAEQQIQHVFQSVSRVCEESGNTVQGGNRPLPDAFMEMLEKIEFGVGPDGDISMPSIYVAPNMGQRILTELQSQSPEYQAKAEALIEGKKASAIAKEQERLQRFKAFRP
ncbi:hypothetical protein [Sphingomonas qomolangmaensis]|uniref:Uncharacterized protein n=1 Tax=Sphingomonas qomolangmaensis TaxID=2918765 RepID=A0ABY5LDL9_9SPHN|nr:hypothetical protein [Sphingomonas qomolangmaensis]UUL83987.1 hypothetical protein NMP03_07290 [Sphingomonas qomolangmaensis]